MPFPLLPLLLMGGSAIGGALSNRSKTQTNTNQQTSSATPTWDPAFTGMRDAVLSQIMGRLQNPSSLPSGYEAVGVGGINESYDLGKQSLENNLSARGLNRSPIAGMALAQQDSRRLGDIGRFRTSLPLLERDMQNQDLERAIGTMGMGRGMTTTSSGTSTGTMPGNMAGGSMDGMAQMLGFLYGQGAFGGGQQRGLNLPSMYQGF